MFGAVFVLIRLLSHKNGILGLITLYRFEKSLETMSGKKEVCRQQLSLKFQQKKKKSWKNTKRKKCHKKQKKASNQAENDHRQHFQENTSTISKNLVPTTQARISLTQQNQRIDFSSFHIYNLLRSLYQLTYKRICFLSHLKTSHHLWW